MLIEGFILEGDHQGVLAASTEPDVTLTDLTFRSLNIRPIGAGTIQPRTFGLDVAYRF